MRKFLKNKTTVFGEPWFSVVYVLLKLLNKIFLFCKRFIPSRMIIMHTAEPRVAFIITISVSVIPLNDTSIERCNAKIETKASAKDIFRSVMSVADVL